MSDSRVTVGRSSFGGVMVRVVHETLGQYDDERRRSILLRDIEDLVETAELLTPEEERWYGPAFNEDPYLPLWAEALARREPDRELLFVSDLDTDLQRPAVVTFYSRNWSGLGGRRGGLILSFGVLMIWWCPGRRRLWSCLSGFRSVMS